MKRRLNPDLFSPGEPSSPKEPLAYSAVASQKLEKDLKETRKQVSRLESLVEVLQSQMAVIAQTNDKRSEAFSRALSELEQEFREHSLVQNRQVKSLQEKLRSQDLQESQIEALVGRFNAQIMQFDNRLASLKRVVSEKDMTLMTYRQMIEQIIKELDGIKKSPRI